jgi:hypothetical protein
MATSPAELFRDVCQVMNSRFVDGSTVAPVYDNAFLERQYVLLGCAPISALVYAVAFDPPRTKRVEPDTVKPDTPALPNAKDAIGAADPEEPAP